MFRFGEFDPGSERTLAACLTHASRARKSRQRDEYSGERVSNAWVIYPPARDNLPKGGLIPDDVPVGILREAKGASVSSSHWRRSPRPIS